MASCQALMSEGLNTCLESLPATVDIMVQVKNVESSTLRGEGF